MLGDEPMWGGGPLAEELEPRLLLAGELYWTVQYIDPLPGDTYACGVDLTASGQVLALSGTEMGERHVMLWRDGQAADITALLPRDPMLLDLPVCALNNAGQVLGTCVDETLLRAYILDSLTGRVEYIQPPEGWLQTWAVDLNDNGQALVFAVDGMMRRRLLLWQAGGFRDITDLLPEGEPGDPLSVRVVALNDRGEVLGCRPLPDEDPWGWMPEMPTRAFILNSEDGALRDLEPLDEDEWSEAVRWPDPLMGEPRALAGDLNDAGQVVGISWGWTDEWDMETYRRACLWEDFAPTELSPILPGFDVEDPPPLTEFLPWVAAINDAGQLLGTVRTEAFLDGARAYILTPMEGPESRLSLERTWTDEVGYGYSVSAADSGLENLRLTTPWGQAVDCAAWLPPGWAGEPVARQEGILSFRAFTEEDGYRRLDLEWAGLSAGAWAALDSGKSQVTLVLGDHEWMGEVDFRSVVQPPDLPVLGSPAPGEVGVSLSPTLRWEAWADAPERGWVYLTLAESGDPQGAYSLSLPSDWTEWQVPARLDPATAYDLGIGFADAMAVLVNHLSISLSAIREDRWQFTTALGGVSQVIVEDSLSGDGALGYGVEAAGTALTGLRVITPWGELFDSAACLPGGWDGQDLLIQGSGWEFEGFTGPDGQERLKVAWPDLSAGQWAALGTAESQLSVFHVAGAWSATAGFAEVSLPAETPAIIRPAVGQRDVGPTPTIEWQLWDDAPPAGMICASMTPAGQRRSISQAALPSSAMGWPEPAPLAPGADYVLAVEFVELASDLVDGASLDVRSLTRQLAHFAVHPLGISRAEVGGGTDYGTTAADLDDAWQYSVSLVGLGFAAAQVQTPWGGSVELVDLLPAGWDGRTPLIARRGPLTFEADTTDGIAHFTFAWDHLSPNQWQQVQTAPARIEVSYPGGAWQARSVGLAGLPPQPEAPHLLRPTPREPEADTVTVEWVPWEGDPADRQIELEVLQHCGGDRPVMVANGRLPPAATAWAPPNLGPGATEVRIAFSERAISEVGGVTIVRATYARSRRLFTTMLPDPTLRIHPDTGQAYVLAPEGTWLEAQDYARSLGGNLVAIDDAEEEAWLVQQYVEEGDWETLWIGLEDLDWDRLWTWVSGQPVTYTNWSSWSPWSGCTAAYLVSNPWSFPDLYWESAYADDEWTTMQGIVELPVGAVPSVPDDYANGLADAAPIGEFDQVEGRLDYEGDVDCFRFDASAGAGYDILLTADGLELADATVWLYDEAGTLLSWGDGLAGGGSRLLWVAPADGTYVLAVEARDLTDYGGYRLALDVPGWGPDLPAAWFAHRGLWLDCGGGRAIAISQPSVGATWDDEVLLHVLDLTDPLAPAEVGRYAMERPAGDAIAWAAHAVVLADHEELIGLDVGGDVAPTELWRLGPQMPHVDAVAVQGDWLYAGTSSPEDTSIAYLEVYDLSGPGGIAPAGLSAPLVSPTGDLAFWARRILVGDGRAYILHADGRTISIVDVSQPASPALLGQLQLPDDLDGEAADIALAGQTLLITVGCSLAAVDVSDPASPAVMARLDLETQGGALAIAGRRAFVGCAGLGVQVVSLADPAAPATAEVYRVFGASGDAALMGGMLLVPTCAGWMAAFVAALPGDADRDGVVGVWDYITLKRNYGRTGGASWADGDFDGDEDVDRNDLLAMKANFGQCAPPLHGRVVAVAPAALAATDGQSPSELSPVGGPPGAVPPAETPTEPRSLSPTAPSGAPGGETGSRQPRIPVSAILETPLATVPEVQGPARGPGARLEPLSGRLLFDALGSSALRPAPCPSPRWQQAPLRGCLVALRRERGGVGADLPYGRCAAHGDTLRSALSRLSPAFADAAGRPRAVTAAPWQSPTAALSSEDLLAVLPAADIPAPALNGGLRPPKARR